jgi:HD-like signal output (HDOD) protein
MDPFMNASLHTAVDLNKLFTAENLPGMPQTAVRLLELSQNPDNGPVEFAVSIEVDPGLTVQILRFVNSSYFSFRSEISNVKQAVTMVGMRTIKNFALWSAVFNMIPNPRCGAFDLKSLWLDSFRRGLFARWITRQLGKRDVEEVFAAALLQDMAVPLLVKELPDHYNRLLDGRKQKRARLSDLEKETFGWTHADAAGIMARQWKLPEVLGELIEGHLRLDDYLQQTPADAAKIGVAISALLPAVVDPDWPDVEALDRAYERARPATAPPLSEAFAAVDSEFAELAPILRIPRPKVPLVQAYQQATATPAV